MDVGYPWCCGVDVHTDSLEACLVRTPSSGPVQIERRHVGTLPAERVAFGDWLVAAGCTHLVMERSGESWKPVDNLLEERLHVWVVNARQVKAVPGRKTDVADAEWLAHLLRHGVVRPSFIPDRAQRALRDLTRSRSGLIDARAAVANRIQAVLEDANLKVAGVVTDILGGSGRAILAALVAGTTDPEALADLGRGQVQRQRATLVQALTGQVQEQQRRLLSVHLEHLATLDAQIERLDRAIATTLEPQADALARLDTIPGVSRATAEMVLAEIGSDMRRFATAGHLASWAGMCPGQYESAGKRKGGRTRKGSRWLVRGLLQAARGAARTRTPGRMGLADLYRRLVRRGKPSTKAAVAVGHRILVIAYYVVRDGVEYTETPPPAHQDRQRHLQCARAVSQLPALGYEVALTPLEPVA